MIIYKLLTVILYPFIYLHLLYRKHRGKEDRFSFAQKLGKTNIERPEKFLIWIHTVSVGEYLSVKPLIHELQKKYNSNILVTTATLSSAGIVKTDKSLIHQYLPIDNIYVINKFIKHWQPDLALWVDSEIWPNLLEIVNKICPTMLINGKLSDKSYKKWSYFKKIFGNILSNFKVIFPQTIEYYWRFKNFGVNNIKYIGNIKYAAANTLLNASIFNNISNNFPKDKLILIAASTHESEESMIAYGYKKIRQEFPDIFLIIAPRHLHRKKKILEDLKDFNISVRSQNEIITSATEIYLADTIGELTYFYQISDIAFIGGSFSDIGGHNPLEAANSNCALIYGHHYSGFREIVEEFTSNKAMYIVSSSEDFIEVVKKLISDKNLLAQRKNSAKKMVKNKENLIDQYIDEIDKYIKKDI